MRNIIALILSVLILLLAGCNTTGKSSNNISSSDNIENNNSIGKGTSSGSKVENAETADDSPGNNFAAAAGSNTGNKVTKPTPEKKYECKSNSSSANSKSKTIKSNSLSAKSNNTSSKPSKTADNNSSSIVSEPQNNFSKFDKKIGIYETKNLPTVSDYYDDRCPAWIGVYSIGKDTKTENEIKEKFKTAFGYYANENVVCTYIGKYNIDAYSMPKEIYQYTIQDLTYPLLQDELYVITKKICDDGSAWVGFPMVGTFENMDTSDRISDLLNQTNDIFCKWTGYSLEYMVSPENSKRFSVCSVSVAGKMRTKDGQVLDILYRFTREYKKN